MESVLSFTETTLRLKAQLRLLLAGVPADLRKFWLIKVRGLLGPGSSDGKEVSIWNRVARCVDGDILYRDELPPSGLASDGASTAYRKFTVPAGTYRLVARLRDSRREDGFDYEKAAGIVLTPQQNFVIDFRPELGGFLFL